MKSRVLMVSVLACVFLAMPAPAQEIQGGMQPSATATPVPGGVTEISSAELAAMDRFQTDYPGTLTYREGPRLTRLYGRTFEMGDTPAESAERFLNSNADLFATRVQDLSPTTRVLESGNTLPLMLDEDTGTYKFTLLYYSQQRDGIPVFRSDIRFLVKNEVGYPLVWVGANLRKLGDFHPNTAVPSAVDPSAAAPGLTLFTAMEPVIWAGVDDACVPPRLAVTFKARNDGTGASQPEKWLFVVDAATGQVLHKESLIHFTSVTGTVKGKATTLPKSDTCNPELDTVMPFAKVTIGSTTAYTNATGAFTIPNSGTTAVAVKSYMDGQYFLMNTLVGTVEVLTLTVTPPGPANFLHNQANMTESVRAQVNAYIQANKIRSWLLSYAPNYPTISTQTDFPIYVNRSDGYCPGNAWYDSSGPDMNFCSAAGSYPNTAYSSVVHHEYGHHMCETAGTGQDQYGEGVGDCVAVCIADDPILGYGFTGDCNDGLRTADNTMQYPCTSDIHTCAQLLSGCVWSTRNALRTSFPTTYLSILSNLMVNSIPLHAGSGTITQSIYADWITLDGGTNGPHYAQITTGFSAHNMTPPPPPANDACTKAARACPGSSYAGSTTNATLDGATTCGTSSNTRDVWYKYKPLVDGTATFQLCGSTYNTVLSIHSGCPGNAANSLSCDDNGCGGTSTSSKILNFNVTSGTTYLIRVSGNNGSSGSYSLSITGPECWPPDTLAPTPDPMTFEVAPAPAGTTSISMTATAATDTESMPPQYYFAFVSGGTGGTDSGWQDDLTYTDSGLMANTVYTYKVKARDSADTPNETGYSGDASTATLIQTPNSVSYGTVTSNSIGLTAAGFVTNLTVLSSGLFFDSTTPGGNAGLNNWVQTMTTTATELVPNTSYTFRVKARNQNAVETGYTPSTSKATLIETPAGVSFGTVTGNSVELIATGPLTNLGVGTSGVYFDCTTTGGDGGINEWVQVPTDTATGLSPNTSYTFQAKARNQSSLETAYSPTATVITGAALPPAPTLSGATATTVNLDVNAGGNSAATEFAVRCTSPADAVWNGMYLDAAGGPSLSPVWQTEAQWGVVTVQGLQSCALYTFAVKARNSELVETAFGAGASIGSGGASGDLNNDGFVNGEDVQPFVNCLIDGGAGCECVTMSVTAFVDCLLNPGMCP